MILAEFFDFVGDIDGLGIGLGFKLGDLPFQLEERAFKIEFVGAGVSRELCHVCYCSL